MALRKEEKTKIIGEFAQSSNDTGSSEVQVALLTKNILSLTEHCKKNKKDFSSKRGLLAMVCNRTRLLRYIERHSVAKYKEIIGKLGLRK